MAGSWNEKKPLPIEIQGVAGFLAVKKLEWRLENAPFFSSEVFLALLNLIKKFKKQKKNGDITEDDQKIMEEDAQKATDASIKDIDKIIADKEKEIMEV